MSAVLDLDQEVSELLKGFDKEKLPLQQPILDGRVSEAFARAMLKTLAGAVQLRTHLVFSKRLRNEQVPCYYRPSLILLPQESSGMLTERRVIHALAHALDEDRARPKPHGQEFQHALRTVEEAWWGKSSEIK